MTALEALSSYFGYSCFRPMQDRIIDSVLQGNDTLALLPTGGGKSLCFQIPTLVMAADAADGKALCLVVTPLIALMKDQVENLRQRDILSAAIYTGMSLADQRTIIDNCRFGPYRFLYVSPERLESEDFCEWLRLLPIRLIAVDEAHCISQWGYDFRPSYLHIAKIRTLLARQEGIGHVPIIALTATATPQVVKDIQDKLSFSRPNVFQTSFARDNLSYVVRYCPEKQRGDAIVHILSRVPGSSIVYVRNRQKTLEVAQYLSSHGIEADFYHAGLLPADRHAKQQEWKHHPRCMVCTNAFGMGIDKPDVRVVIHYDLPDSLEAYFQEAGRAGRDGKAAYAVLLYDTTDKTKARRRVSDSFPDKELISTIYHKTCDFLGVGAFSGQGITFFVPMDNLIRIMHLPPVATYSALHLLSNVGYISFKEHQDILPRILIRVPQHELAQYALSEKQIMALENLMRHYTGIFTELQYIHEKDIDHDLFVSLAERHIISYIPRQVADTLTFTMDRQTEVFMPVYAYEERREVYIDKLRAMVEYAENDRFCRSQVLLHYFGQTDAPVCHTCDICRQRNGER